MTANNRSLTHALDREDDTNWPKKNIVGKQELEIRIGSDHIAFEVRSVVALPPIPSNRSPPGTSACR